VKQTECLQKQTVVSQKPQTFSTLSQCDDVTTHLHLSQFISSKESYHFKTFLYLSTEIPIHRKTFSALMSLSTAFIVKAYHHEKFSSPFESKLEEFPNRTTFPPTAFTFSLPRRYQSALTFHSIEVDLFN
jgi:hypothetical protein